MHHPSRALLRSGLLASLLAAGTCGPGPDLPPVEGPAPPVEIPTQVDRSPAGMVVAAQPLATRAGVEMLEMGGNAADAAVAAGFALTVVESTMNSIGGRTQILVRLPDGTVRGIDATTQAPMGYDPATAPRADSGYPVIGVPGTVAGLTRLLEEYGTLPLETVMAPAIRYAADGYEVLPGEASRREEVTDQIREFESTSTYFLEEDGTTHDAGEVFVQPDLAATLRAIAAGGADAFYAGDLARRIAADMEANEGTVTLEALRDYRALDARIVRGSYRGFELVASYHPAGGATSIEALHIMERFELEAAAPEVWAAVTAQALALAFQDRDAQGPDEAGARLTSKEWARGRAREVQVPEAVPVAQGTLGLRARASGPARLALGGPGPPRENDEEGHTTHLSTADSAGMAVALTQTLGPNMGSKVAAPGLGFLWASTLGGYLGELEAGERASSNISPIMVLRDGEPVLVLGAAGGSRIVSAVVQAISRHVDYGLDLPEALLQPRVHPVENGLQVEETDGTTWSPEQLEAIRALGLEVETVHSDGRFGRIHGIQRDGASGEWIGAADPDWEGSADEPGRR